MPGFVCLFFFPRFESFGANNFWIYQLFLGHWLPNLKNPKLPAQHQQLWTNIVPKQKELYFWEGPQTWENTASKIIVPEKKELNFWKGTHTWKNTASKIIVPEKRNYIFGSVPNVQKNSFKNYSSGKKGTIFLERPKRAKKQLQEL